MKYNKFTVPNVDLSDVGPGDVLMRMLAGVVPMPIVVGKVEDGKIYTGSHPIADKGNPAGPISWELGWVFDQKTGLEIDDDIPGTVSFISEIVSKFENNKI